MFKVNNENCSKTSMMSFQCFLYVKFERVSHFFYCFYCDFEQVNFWELLARRNAGCSNDLKTW